MAPNHRLVEGFSARDVWLLLQREAGHGSLHWIVAVALVMGGVPAPGMLIAATIAFILMVVVGAQEEKEAFQAVFRRESGNEGKDSEKELESSISS